MPNFWDDRFAEPGYKYGTTPNAFLREQAARLSDASQVLVPGDGDFGVVIFIPKVAGIDPDLLAFCAQYASRVHD